MLDLKIFKNEIVEKYRKWKLSLLVIAFIQKSFGQKHLEFHIWSREITKSFYFNTKTFPRLFLVVSLTILSYLVEFLQKNIPILKAKLYYN